MNLLSRFGVVLTVSATLFATAAAAGEMIVHRTDFDVRFGALPIGTASFRIQFDDKSYRLGAQGKTVGVAELLAPGTGKAASSGRIVDNRIIAEHHTVTYLEKRKEKEHWLELEFDGGDVKAVRLEPDERKSKKGPKWIAIRPGQLHKVLDPASSIIVPVEWKRANDPRAVCDRRLPVYDGDTRFDIQLHYKATRRISTEGYQGYAYVCQLRYVPVAGHKRGQKNVNYMRDNENMEIWLAPMAKTNLYTPIRIEVPTWVGTFTATPKYFGIVRN